MWLIAMLFACREQPIPPITEIGNPERNLGVAAAALELPSGTTTIESAWGALGEIKLQLDEQYVSGDEEIEWETPEVITDLAAGPLLVDFRSPNARYNRIIFRPRTSREDRVPGSPPELEDGSFVISGTRSDGVPFLLVSETEEDIELVGMFELADSQKSLALGFTIDSWVEDAALENAVVESGEIVIDRNNNTALLEDFEDRLPESIVFADDLDGDGEVDDTDLVLLE